MIDSSLRKGSMASIDTERANGHEEKAEKVTYDFLKLARADNSSTMLKDMSFNVDISKLYNV